MTPTTQMETALHPTKDNSAAHLKTLKHSELSKMQCTTNRRPPAMPRKGTAAHAGLLARIAAGPAGVCPQQFFDDTGKSLRHAVSSLRRRRWRIESRWSRQRVASEMAYVLVEV